MLQQYLFINLLNAKTKDTFWKGEVAEVIRLLKANPIFLTTDFK